MTHGVSAFEEQGYAPASADVPALEALCSAGPLCLP